MSETTKIHQVVGLTTKLRIAGAIDLASVTDGLARVMMSGARCQGFWSAEIIPPAVSRGEWTLVERFKSADEASAWMSSAVRKSLLEELRSVAPTRILVSDEIAEDPGTPGTVATAVVTHVKEGMEAAYWDWEARIQSAQARFPGYRGTYIQPPLPDNPGRWTTLLRFDTPETLDAWLASDVRKMLLSEANLLVNTTQFHNMSSSFPGWFPADASKRLPIWKTAFLVLIALYPVIVCQKVFLVPHLAGINQTLVIAITTTISVCLVSWVGMPLLVKAFDWWLRPQAEQTSAENWKGAVIVLLTLLLQIGLFWSL